ncbi:MAG: transglutaminase-like domain-containing protein [Desulfatiglandales bacterium]
MEENPYLTPTFFIDSDTVSIRETSETLTRNLKGKREQAKALFNFVRDEIRYNVFSPRHSPEYYRAGHVLQRGEGYCVQKAVLLVALARAAGIPSRLRFADIRTYTTPPELLEKRGTDVFAWHGLADLLIHGTWIRLTPIYPLDYCKRVGIYPVLFDGENDALLPLLTPDGRPHNEYILDRGSYADLPIDEIQKASLSGKYVRTQDPQDAGPLDWEI